MGVGALLSGCKGQARVIARPADYRGDILVTPFAEPDFTLTATDGRPYRFKQAAEAPAGGPGAQAQPQDRYASRDRIADSLFFAPEPRQCCCRSGIKTAKASPICHER